MSQLAFEHAVRLRDRAFLALVAALLLLTPVLPGMPGAPLTLWAGVALVAAAATVGAARARPVLVAVRVRAAYAHRGIDAWATTAHWCAARPPRRPRQPRAPGSGLV